ncbi:hypothetical protein CQW23_29224 [Capsicum baccatum]|uniref:Uncharacterized protein n=1 Tax=Capsicum baccatum TaxID=33114 RepID=A0A2G2VIV3_CAPBA|nr:hypothetical protein CQW23_29224 [Capsicum baccatum]
MQGVTLNNLSYLHLDRNLLSGPIPAEIGKMKSLQNLSLHSNNLSGLIPNELGNPKKLNHLGLSNNQLSGPIPSELGILKNLNYLALSNNQLSGPIPSGLWNLKNLNHLALSNINSVAQFLYLFLGYNNLTTEGIPSFICNLTSIVRLNLSGNNLKGEIPQCLGNISGLLEMRMSDNSLSGEIPLSICNLTSLQQTISREQFRNVWVICLVLRFWICNTTIFPGPLRVVLALGIVISEASTYMAISFNLEAMKRVNQTLNESSNTGDGLYTTVDFSSNRFEGDIPGFMGDLIALRVINLSHNELEGHISTSLGNLPSVESLDLSSNHLEGKIPEQLTSLTLLEFLNLSYNQLQGCIPTGPQFATFKKDSYTGNDGLRGFPVLEGCGRSGLPETNNPMHVLDEDSNSTFLSEFDWKVVLTGYACGLSIGFSIAYIMLSS